MHDRQSIFCISLCIFVITLLCCSHAQVGILLGAWPCGQIMMIGELYGSESMSQVYGHIHTLLQENSSHLPKVYVS